MDEATRCGIVVVHAPGSDVTARAEQALALLLRLRQGCGGGRRRAARRGGARRAGRRPGAAAPGAVELRGKTLGLDGLDGSSQALAEAAQALRMTVIACGGGEAAPAALPADP